MSGRQWLFKLGRVLREETAALQPRLLLAGLLAGVLPRLAFSRVRISLYRLFGLRAGARSLLLGRPELSGRGDILSRFRMGEDCIINTPFFVDLNAEVTLGNGVSIGHHCSIITSGHEVGPATRRAGAVKPAAVVVEDGCWLGAGVTLLPGTRLRRGCVIAPGSLVSGDVPADKLLGGVPARVIRSLAEDK